MTQAQVRWALDQKGLTDAQRMLLVIFCNSADSNDDEQRIPIEDVVNCRADTRGISDDLHALWLRGLLHITGKNHKYVFYWLPDYAAGYKRRDELSPQERAGEQRSARGKISPSKRLRIYRRDGFECVVCGSNDDLTLDHIVPFSDNGSDDDSNLQTMCRSCNSRKGTRGWNVKEG